MHLSITVVDLRQEARHNELPNSFTLTNISQANSVNYLKDKISHLMNSSNFRTRLVYQGKALGAMCDADAPTDSRPLVSFGLTEGEDEERQQEEYRVKLLIFPPLAGTTGTPFGGYYSDDTHTDEYYDEPEEWSPLLDYNALEDNYGCLSKPLDLRCGPCNWGHYVPTYRFDLWFTPLALIALILPGELVVVLGFVYRWSTVYHLATTVLATLVWPIVGLLWFWGHMPIPYLRRRRLFGFILMFLMIGMSLCLMIGGIEGGGALSEYTLLTRMAKVKATTTETKRTLGSFGSVLFDSKAYVSVAHAGVYKDNAGRFGKLQPTCAAPILSSSDTKETAFWAYLADKCCLTVPIDCPAWNLPIHSAVVEHRPFFLKNAHLAIHNAKLEHRAVRTKEEYTVVRWVDPEDESRALKTTGYTYVLGVPALELLVCIGIISLMELWSAINTRCRDIPA